MSDEEAADGGDQGYTEETTESYLDQMKDSCQGAGFGLLLFFMSFVLLIWNEARTVRRAQDIDEGREVVLTLDLNELQQQSAGNNSSSSSSSIFSTLFDDTDMTNNKAPLVYVTGDLSEPTVPLVDPVFGVSSTEAIKLARTVEMYQWKETSTSRREKRANGKTVTVTEYSYSKSWESYLIDSSQFRQARSDRVNPSSFPFEAQDYVADPILLQNVLALGDPVVDRLDWWKSVTNVSLSYVPDNVTRQNLDLYERKELFYTTVRDNTTADNPAVGDARIAFAQVATDTISIIAGLMINNNNTNPTLGNYITRGGRNLLLVEQGTLTVDEMFTQAENENTTLAWILRFLGFALMATSIYLVLQPIAQAVDIIPLVGDFLQGGLENCIIPTIAFLISLPLSLITIALAWLAYRPLWSVPILVVSIGISVWLCMRAKQVTQGGGGSDSDDDDEEEFKPSMPSSNYTSSGGGGDGGGGGFANALDNDPPPKPSNDDEQEIAVADPNQPYVPQVFKP